MKANDMSERELNLAANNMRMYGGSFAGHIANAYFVADSTNVVRLVDAFPELFEKYAPGQGWGHE
jgi:hypothetical protein